MCNIPKLRLCFVPILNVSRRKVTLSSHLFTLLSFHLRFHSPNGQCYVIRMLQTKLFSPSNSASCPVFSSSCRTSTVQSVIKLDTCVSNGTPFSCTGYFLELLKSKLPFLRCSMVCFFFSAWLDMGTLKVAHCRGCWGSQKSS